VAAIVHDRHLLDDPGLIDAVCAPAALAIENERLQAELRAQVQEVQASERRLRDVLENVRLVAVSTDVEGRITFANRFLCDLAGYAPEELVGRDWAETFNPGSTIAAQLASGTSRSHEEAPLRTRSGDVRAMEWSTTVTRDADGRVDGGTGIGLDVTERNRAAAELRDLARQQAALRRVATAVAAADEPERIFALVTEEVARLLSGDTANLIRFDDGGAYTVVGEWSLRAGSGVPIGDSGPLDPRTAAGTVAATGRPARVDYADVEGELAGVLRALGIRASVAAPISVQGRLWGAIRVSTTGDRGLPADAETRIAEFTELVALALSNADAHTQLRASRARIVAAGDSERRRLERNLHDGAQQRLVALSLALRMARSAVDGNPAAGELLESASAELMQALEELRELARGIHPAVLTDRGLEAAVDMLAARSPVPVRATIDLDRRETDPQVQAAVYYVIAESLTNVAKYAGARSVQVAVTSDGRLATVRVVDDGGGGATPVRGGGLSGLTDRVEALGGTLTVVSPPRAGTVVSATLPLEARIAPAARLVGAARAAGDGDRAAETR
jgi:PAS domain S-box-containing protein